MKYNAYDKTNYLTAAEWTATEAELKANPSNDTAKFFEVDTGVIHLIYDGNDYDI